MRLVLQVVVHLSKLSQRVLNLAVQDFAKVALFAKGPIDLGSSCTVFMNSK